MNETRRKGAAAWEEKKPCLNGNKQVQAIRAAMITSKKTQQRHFFAVNRIVKPFFFFFFFKQAAVTVLKSDCFVKQYSEESVVWRDKSSNASVRAWKLMSPQLLAGLNSGWARSLCSLFYLFVADVNNQSLNKQRCFTKYLTKNYCITIYKMFITINTAIECLQDH